MFNTAQSARRALVQYHQPKDIERNNQVRRLTIFQNSDGFSFCASIILYLTGFFSITIRLQQYYAKNFAFDVSYPSSQIAR